MDIFDLYDAGMDLGSDPDQTVWVAPLLWIGDAVFTAFVSSMEPYKEIEFDPHTDLVRKFQHGVRDYGILYERTGRYAYPAGDVYVNWAMYKLTDQGLNLEKARYIHALVYLTTLLTAMLVYRMCKAPPYLIALLVLSNSMRGIFTYHLGNDSFVPILLLVAVFALQRRNWVAATIVFSTAGTIRLSTFAALPGAVAVISQAMPFKRALKHGFLLAGTQGLLALPFLMSNYNEYFKHIVEGEESLRTRAAVKWSFLDEQVRAAAQSQNYMLLGNLLVITALGLTRWIGPISGSVKTFLQRLIRPLPEVLESSINGRVTPLFTTTAIFAAVIVSMTFSPELQYRHFVYLGWVTPMVLWRAKLHPILIYAVCGAQERAWMVSPPSTRSSRTIAACLAIQILGVWWGTRQEIPKLKYFDQYESKSKVK